MLVRGKAAFGGSMTFKGSLIVLPGAELNVESRHVTVTRSLIVSGILRMQDARDTVTVLGDSAVFTARNDAQVKNYATSGVLRAAGNIRIDSTGFYPTGSHKTVFNGGTSKSARGMFHHLEIAGTVVGSANVAVSLRSSFVRGNLTATNGVSKIRLDTVTVDGNADLSQSDTVTIGGTSNTGDPRTTAFKGNLKVRNIALIGTGIDVFGDLTLGDGAWLSGFALYRGKYTELGSVNNPLANRAALFGVLGVRYVQQPTNTKVNTAFSPVVTVEIIGVGNTRIIGTAVVYLNSSANYSGPTRVVTVDGSATFTGLTPTSASNGRTIEMRVRRPDFVDGTVTSSTFDVAP